MEQGDFRFDRETHRYFYKNIEIPSVTSVLKSAGLVSFIDVPDRHLDFATIRGKAVHLATQYDDLGTLDEGTLHSALIGYLESWRNFKQKCSVEIIDVEKPLFSAKWMFGGTRDRLAIIGGKVTIIDLKTASTSYPANAIQVAGYKILQDENCNGNRDRRVKRRMVVMLKSDGKFLLEEYFDHEADERIFISALMISKFKERMGLR